MVKHLNITSIIFLIILLFIFFNLALSYSDITNIFSFLFIFIGLVQVYVGIRLLNEKRKVLSTATFLLSLFFLSLVGIKIYLESHALF